MAINVLMLGWELPPYNSGGLGTACLGLTESLSNQGVSIRFVVPKVFGKLPFNHMDVVGATDFAAGDDEIKQLLESEEFKKEWLSHQLAYGNKVSMSENKKLLVEFLKQKLPIAPHTQATWYAYQAAAIARAHPDFEVVHSHDWFTYYGGMAARQVSKSKGKHAPFVAHIHATEVDRCGVHGDPRITQIEKVGLNQADRVVAVSHYTKAVVHKHYGVPKEKISVVHNGIPLHKKPQQFDLHELKKHHKVVLFMGRITMQKGPEYFIQLAKAVTDVDPSVRFIMVGSGDMTEHCIDLSAKLGLTRKMLFNPFARGTEVDQAYQMADLFVMPSVSEPFGLVALEAIQNGTPVLSSRQAGVIEVTGNIMHENFWDIEAMKKAVLYALRNPDFAQKMVQDGQRELPQLTWNQAADKMRAVYQHVIDEAKLAAMPHHPVAAKPA